MTEELVLHAGEGERHVLADSSSATIKATAEATAGRFFFSECDLAAGFAGPPPHVHDELGPGGFACALPGTRHMFANRSGGRVRFLNSNAPGGFEQYMRDLAAAAASGPMSSERMGEVASRYDVRVVG